MKTIATIFILFLFIPGLYTQTTKTFRQGVNGYDDCHSVDISDLNIQGNNNGTSFGDSNNDWCIGKLHNVPGMGYDISPLLKFDSLNIPYGAQVTSASLTVTLMMWVQPSCRIVGRYINVPWHGNIVDPNGGVTNAPVGWQRRLPNTSWAVNGALGEGTDLISGKYFVLPPDSSIIPSNGYVTYTVPLDVSVVQSWVNNSSQNNGVKLQCDAQDVHIYYVQPQRPDVNKRPMLSITYIISTGVSGNGQTISGYSLEQNYPNPFNPVTNVTYSIPSKEFVKLYVHDVLGKTVAVLFNGIRDAGTHMISFDASFLPSGLYFCKIETEKFTDSKKLILIK